MRTGRAFFVIVAGLAVAGAASAASLLVDGNTSESLSFSANAGGTVAQCVTQTGPPCFVSVTSSTSPLQLIFSASASTTSGGNWLSVSTTSTTTPATLTITADPTGLQAGNYSGTITLTCFVGTPCTPATISVSLSISGIVLTSAPNPAEITVTAGQTTSMDVTLTGLGGGTTATATVVSGGGWLQATVVSPTKLTLNVNGAGLQAGSLKGSVQLQCQGGSPCLPLTQNVDLTVNGVVAPVSISSLSPSGTTPGGPAFTLTINGSGFTNTSLAEWNSSALSTSFVSSSQLNASVPASLIASAGTATVKVVNTDGGISNSVTFSIGSGGPAITSISPSSAAAGSASLSITIAGSGFVNGAVAQWNGLALSTSFSSSTSLSAQITAGDLVSPGTGQITVKNPNGLISNSVPFLVSTNSPLQFVPVAPCRVADTRPPAISGINFPANSPFGPPFIPVGTARTIPIPASTNCPGVPTNAAAFSLNFTVQPRTPNQGALTVWPAGTTQPNTSTLNFSNPALVLAAAAIVPAGASGGINATATQDIDLIVDINGYFVPPSAGTLQFYPLAPCRVLDTRTPANGGTFPANSFFGSPSLDGKNARSFVIPQSPNNCGAPTNAAAYSFNVGVVPQGALFFLAAYPTGGTLPVVSTMNSFDGTILANAAIVPAGPGGAVNFFASNPTDFFVDINGYFAPPGAGGLNFYAVSPCRLVDTRKSSGTFGGPSMGALTTRSFPLPQTPCGIPAAPAVQAYSLGITVYPTSGPLSYLTTWPTGGAQPFVSTLNAFKGLPIANAALVPAGTGGAINVFVTDPADVTIDTAGYFGP